VAIIQLFRVGDKVEWLDGALPSVQADPPFEVCFVAPAEKRCPHVPHHTEIEDCPNPELPPHPQTVSINDSNGKLLTVLSGGHLKLLGR